MENQANKIDLNSYDKNIIIKGARLHNLKNISLSIPRNKFVVITGLSGSGKSTLAFDTLYAEGQRRYVESLSAYARQFLGRINKPEVDFIKGIPPAIAIEQKVTTKNTRSTVGTSTEIYDYMKLLFARIGKTISPISGQVVKRHSVDDVVKRIVSFPEGTKITLLAPIVVPEGRDLEQQLQLLLAQGITRIMALDNDNNQNVINIADLDNPNSLSQNYKEIFLLIDRFKSSTRPDAMSRMGDSVQTAFYEGEGDCMIEIQSDKGTIREYFCTRFEADGIKFEEPSIYTFTFNNPVGACPTCGGIGRVIGIDEDLVVPNKSLSVYDNAVKCWCGPKMGEWKDAFIRSCYKYDFPIHKPYNQLTDNEKDFLWKGAKGVYGINDFFQMVEKESYKIQFRVMLARYRGQTNCPDCKGTRLKKEAQYIKVAGHSITDLVKIPVDELLVFFKNIELTDNELEISKRILVEIISRLEFLCDVGLGYLNLNRLSSTLSGGESQRINLATSLGSSLTGSLYILDEPSIGLHTRDTQKLIKVLKKLRDLGNTVIVVEHDEEIIRSADQIIDIGPEAGVFGGEIMFQGDFSMLNAAENSLTAKYLIGKEKIQIPERRIYNPKSSPRITIKGARMNNLKNITVDIPLFMMTVVTGVSGSGKSSLIKGILYPALAQQINDMGEKPGEFDGLEGDLSMLNNVEIVDQNPVEKSSRSNPVTYIKVYDDIRKLYAEQQLAKQMGYTAGFFSFNTDGGRCEECQGDGIIKVEMQFMADVYLVCESCGGKRFKDDILEVKYRGKNIYDILEMSVDEAVAFFDEDKENSLAKKIAKKLKVLKDVGLDYIKLGQTSSTLSGGENQRIKLATFLLNERSDKRTLFIFDEPTTGLHFHDIKKLLKAINALIDRGNSVLIIEHDPEVIKCADYLIDLGPDGGKNGGEVVFTGTPEEIVKCKKSYTGQYLKESKKLE
ncbi:MAG: excinuclease ABC subunit UvrA [Bacteroidales bacterium]|nr:excinuclease ABC subunit UvrA [Bacteroidales bacterium]